MKYLFHKSWVSVTSYTVTPRRRKPRSLCTTLLSGGGATMRYSKLDARKQDSCWDFVYKLPFFLSLFSLKIPVLLTDFLIVNLRRFSRLMCPLSIVVNWLSACHITKGQDFSRNKNIFLAEHFLALCPSSEEIGLLSLKAIFRAFCKM